MLRSCLLTILAILAASTCQAQLMDDKDDRIWRSYVPKIDDPVAKLIPGATLYTTKEIPQAYQHQPIGARYTVFYRTSTKLNNDPRPTNGNREPPWDRPGGLENVPRSEVMECRFIILPPRPGGGVWPVVVGRRELEKSIAVNMPVPMGWGWWFPDKAILGELLIKKFSDGSWQAYEVRMRQRELDDWDVDAFRPYVSFDEFESALVKRGVSAKHSPVSFVRHRDNHPTPAFIAEGMTLTLPQLSGAKDLLSKATFKSVTGSDYLLASRFFYPTANDQDNLVPRGYGGHLIGNTRESCVNCHDDTLKNVDSFEKPRDWYDYIRGSDGIFSFNPFDPSCFGPPEQQPILSRKLEAAGMVAMYDEKLHPATVYKIAKRYDNPPAGSANSRGLQLERRGPRPAFPGGL